MCSFSLALLLAGCDGGGGLPLDAAQLTGTCALTKLFAISSVGETVTLHPPEVSGTLTITAASRYTLDLSVGGTRITDEGSMSVADPNITCVSRNWSSLSGKVSSGGRKITLTWIEAYAIIKVEFEKE